MAITAVPTQGQIVQEVRPTDGEATNLAAAVTATSTNRERWGKAISPAPYLFTGLPSEGQRAPSYSMQYSFHRYEARATTSNGGKSS